MSQRALGKVTTQGYISSQRYIPNNVTLKKRTVCILIKTGASLRLGPGNDP